MLIKFQNILHNRYNIFIMSIRIFAQVTITEESTLNIFNFSNFQQKILSDIVQLCAKDFLKV